MSSIKMKALKEEIISSKKGKYLKIAGLILIILSLIFPFVSGFLGLGHILIRIGGAILLFITGAIVGSKGTAQDKRVMTYIDLVLSKNEITFMNKKLPITSNNVRTYKTEEENPLILFLLESKNSGLFFAFPAIQTSKKPYPEPASLSRFNYYINIKTEQHCNLNSIRNDIVENSDRVFEIEPQYYQPFIEYLKNNSFFDYSHFQSDFFTIKGNSLLLKGNPENNAIDLSKEFNFDIDLRNIRVIVPGGGYSTFRNRREDRLPPVHISYLHLILFLTQGNKCSYIIFLLDTTKVPSRIEINKLENYVKKIETTIFINKAGPIEEKEILNEKDINKIVNFESHLETKGIIYKDIEFIKNNFPQYVPEVKNIGSSLSHPEYLEDLISLHIMQAKRSWGPIISNWRGERYNLFSALKGYFDINFFIKILEEKIKSEEEKLKLIFVKELLLNQYKK